MITATRAKARTRTSVAPAAKPGADFTRNGGASATKALHPKEASKTPRTPPAIESTKLSVNSCRIMRLLSAPNAFLTANSFARPEPRASNRLAMLAHAISRTKITAPIRTKRAARVSPEALVRKVINWALHPFRSLCIGSIRSDTVFICASACCKLIPGFSRPIPK